MTPEWLQILAIISSGAAGLSALLIVIDELAGYPQKMQIMNVVWPVTALYFGPFALIAYLVMGRPSAKRQNSPSQKDGKQHKNRAYPFWESVFVGVTHCGAGCTLGDIIGEWTIFWAGLTLAGLALWPEYFLDYVLAYLLGIIFQFFAIAPMRGLSLWPGIVAAIKADTLSLTAFEIGLFGWMALYNLVIFHPKLHPDSPVYWFMMQIGMIIGFGTSYPMNWWLIRKGIKEAM